MEQQESLEDLRKMWRRMPTNRLWGPLELIGLREAALQAEAEAACESGGHYGLRWHTRSDLHKVPEAPGVCVLFFEKFMRFQVFDTLDLLQQLTQCRYAPGMTFRTFSWVALDNKDDRYLVARALKRQQYSVLCDNILPRALREELQREP